jgi:enolase
MHTDDQAVLDNLLCKLDGTTDKSRLGANAILAVSLATARATAQSRGMPLYRYIAELADNSAPLRLPLPMMNIINGGKHATDSTDIQEFMIMPVGARSFNHCLQIGTEIFHALATVLATQGYGTTVGDEGGYAPAVQRGNIEALEMIATAIDKAGYRLGHDVLLALDVASTELLVTGHANRYHLTTEQKTFSSSQLIEYYQDLIGRFPIASIEDGLAEDDWAGWQQLNQKLGAKIQLVGDDIFVTNPDFLQRGITERSANAILIKPNQIGSLTETISTVKQAHRDGWKTIMSHRSGETEDTTITHLAVGLGCGQIKIGSLSRTDRVAKYNELLRIEEELMNDDLTSAELIFAGRDDLWRGEAN